MTNPYAAPQGPDQDTDQGTLIGSLPGVSKPITVQPAGLWAGVKILVGGAQAPKAGFGKVKIIADDGRELIVRYQAQLTGGYLAVGKERYPIGPRVPAMIGIFTVLPLSLIFIGGVIGGLFGGLGLFANRQIAQSNRSTGLKLTLMFGTLMLAAFATLLAAGAFTMLLQGTKP